MTWRLCQTLAFVFLLALAAPFSAHAAPVLRSADIRVVIASDNACSVTMNLVVEGGTAVDHRIEAADDTGIQLSGIRGARQLQDLRAIGRTQSLVLETTPTAYELAYSVQRPETDDRCPVWVPVAPADGVSRAVRISVELPTGMAPRATMPAFAWNGSTGTTTLGHIPAFVRAAYGPAGESTAWDVVTTMDALAIVMFAGASGIWAWRRRR